MSRDYKPAQRKSSSGGNSKGSPFFTGLLVGLLLGVGISVGVAIVVMKSDSPFSDKAGKPKLEPGEIALPKSETKPANEAGNGQPGSEKPRFDFYTILPGTESQVTEQEIKQKEADPAPAQTQESYFLQVGAFQTEQEADNMKAKLALLGQEAIVQTATIPGKGVWHRVRVGPFADLNQINSAKSDLAQNGFKADLIKVNSPGQ
ncbi:SPOR domain-containing protein [Methylobacillus flagellatus]|uniref:SPOR domain-containing protein n=1 Tax=Methylobacillus flagellatus TaxID=405 RepID=UPI002853B7B1|nr:SPOR domain-containing protein [Methylobacillus flagellatus]MDR5172061.1 SPOR domain-containing protein [Methylobacillus flagellatus]